MKIENINKDILRDILKKDYLKNTKKPIQWFITESIDGFIYVANKTTVYKFSKEYLYIDKERLHILNTLPQILSDDNKELASISLELKDNMELLKLTTDKSVAYIDRSLTKYFENPDYYISSSKDIVIVKEYDKVVGGVLPFKI